MEMVISMTKKRTCKRQCCGKDITSTPYYWEYCADHRPEKIRKINIEAETGQEHPFCRREGCTRRVEEAGQSYCKEHFYKNEL